MIPETLSLERVRALLAGMQGAPVLVLGDLMLDVYLRGRVDRISPEGPVPIVAVEERGLRLGGAANVAWNVQRLGGEPRLVGLIGDDAQGAELRSLLEEAGIETDGLVKDPARPTSVKTRVLGGGQQICRYDTESRETAAGVVLSLLTGMALEALAGAKAVLLSDYGKGVMADGLVTAIIHEANALGIPVVVDPKEGHFAAYRGADLMTPNKAEAAGSFGIPIRDEADLERVGAGLMERTGVRALMITLGEKGIALFESSRASRRFPARARQVFDVTGAGDTVVSVLALALAAGGDLAEGAELANRAAGIVVAQVGTAAVDPAALLRACMEGLLGEAGEREGRVMSLAEAARWAKAARAEGKRVVFTNGCFDILHFGHYALLSEAARQGDLLVVGLNSDDSVGRLKGPSRPVNRQEERAGLLAHFRSVDAVVIFEQDDPLALIESLRPDVLVKGDEYEEAQIVGAAEVKSWGGRVHRFPMQQGYSTTLLLQKQGREA